MAPADRYKRKLDEAAWFLSADGNLPYEAHVEFIQNRLAGVDWIVLIEENRMLPFKKVRQRFPIAHTYYRRLAEESLGFERVAQFKVPPEVLGFAYSEADAEPTITGFDHPLVAVYRRSGANVEDLLERWKAEIRTDPALPDKYAILGVKAYRRKAWRQAENAFRRSLEVKPEFALGRLLLREVYIAEGRHADAKRELRRIAESGLTAGAYVGLIRVGPCGKRREVSEQISQTFSSQKIERYRSAAIRLADPQDQRGTERTARQDKRNRKRLATAIELNAAPCIILPASRFARSRYRI